MIDLDRLTDVELLRTIAKVQDREIRRLHEQLSALTLRLAAAKGNDAGDVAQQLKLLQQQLDEAYRRTYSQGGSERRPHAKAEPAEKAPQTGHGPTPQPHLPIVPQVHELDVADRRCSSCGGELAAWDGQFEDSEEVDVVDVQYVLRKHRRQKYRCSCGGCVETAPGPTKLIPGGRYSLDFAVHVAVEKYADHLPLERQVTRMARAGLVAQSQTLWDQTWALHEIFKPALERLHGYLLAKEVLLADESHWPMLGAAGRKTKNWFTWALVSDDAVLYSLLDSRSNAAASTVLRDFRGVLLTDGYVVYESQARQKGFVLAHDWCHARRKFIEAEPTSPDESRAFLDDIGKLFVIEREIAAVTEKLSSEEARAARAQLRAERSRPVVDEIGRRATTIRALRESPIAKAVRYLDNMWEGLNHFLSDPRVPITSNAAERALRCAVLGRKNHLGSRSERGAEVAETFYSLIESARLNGLEPRAYLRRATLAGLRGDIVPLPHELAQS